MEKGIKRMMREMKTGREMMKKNEIENTEM
jgi:hypothetical protein